MISNLMKTALKNRDHFALFNLPRRYTLDLTALEERYRQVQAEVHPDKHATASATQQQQALQWATQVNEAWHILKEPLSRASYLLQLAGIDVHSESATSATPEFLAQQIEQREAVTAAANDLDRLDELHRNACNDLSRMFESIRDAIDRANDLPRAARLVREAMFQNKLIDEIDQALDNEQLIASSTKRKSGSKSRVAK